MIKAVSVFLKTSITTLLFSWTLNIYANDDCLYLYKAYVVDVYDGDTITVDIDLGFNTWRRDEKIRLARINAPEVRGAEKIEGKASRDWLRDQILDKEIMLRTIKSSKGSDSKGKFGRYLGEVLLDGVNMNDALVQAGHAEYKDY